MNIKNLDKVNKLKRGVVLEILLKVYKNKYIKKVVIFGSSVREDCREESDLDIAIEWTEECFDRDGVYKFFTIPVIETISMITKGNNDVVSIGYEGPILRDVIKNGIVVCEKGNENKSNTVNSLEWMLRHRGIALAKKVSDKDVEIIWHSVNPDEYKEIETLAQNNGLILMVGAGIKPGVSLMPSMVDQTVEEE